jgi:leucyl-tRNA synthetase
MPISAAAKKLTFELESYGNPPQLPPLPEDSEVKYQYNLMKQLEIPQEIIPNFTDPTFWTRYFPPMGRESIKRFGVHVDHSRSFITTAINPYYDSFIRWQFTLLK